MKFFKFLIIFSLLLVSCSTAKQDPRHFRLSLVSEPPSLDPNQATDDRSSYILNQIYAGLTRLDRNLNLKPNNAKSWEASPDGKTFTFHLDSNFKWSDGKTVTAQDYVNSWTRLLDPKTASSYAYFLYDIKGAKEFNSGKNKDPKSIQIKALDKFTLEVTLTKSISFFPMVVSYMATYPVRTDLVKKNPKVFTEATGHISNGPYKLVSWEHDKKLILKPNPYYGGKIKPYINKVTIHIVPELVTALALYLRGDLDYLELHPLAVKQYLNHPDHFKLPLLSSYYYGFNVSKSPFNQPHWRKAFAISLNKDKLLKVLSHQAEPINSWVPIGMFGYNKNIGFQFDPKKAKELIKDDLKKGNLPKIELHYNTEAFNKKVAEWAQAEWLENLGIEVDIVNEEWKTYLKRLDTNPPALFRMGWGADYPDPDNFMNLFTSYSGNNYTTWSDPKYDEMVKEASQISDKKQRIQIYDKAQKFLLEDTIAVIPLFVRVKHFLIKKRYHPFPLTSMEVIIMNEVRNHSDKD